MRGIRSAVLVLILAMTSVACVGGAATTTTTVAAATTTTTAAPQTTTTTSGTIAIDQIPQECVDAFANYLKAIEPFVVNVDFAKATLEELDAMGTKLDSATAEYEQATTSAGCDELSLDLSDEQSFALIIDLAQREAPGTVAYWEWIRDFAGSTATTVAASGDCETDIAAVRVFVDRGGTMRDLTAAELVEFSTLIGAVSIECSTDRAGEFFTEPEVAAFLESG